MELLGHLQEKGFREGNKQARLRSRKTIGRLGCARPAPEETSPPWGSAPGRSTSPGGRCMSRRLGGSSVSTQWGRGEHSLLGDAGGPGGGPGAEAAHTLQGCENRARLARGCRGGRGLLFWEVPAPGGKWGRVAGAAGEAW